MTDTEAIVWGNAYAAAMIAFRTELHIDAGGAWRFANETLEALRARRPDPDGHSVGDTT
jgi:hypothetical protein